MPSRITTTPSPQPPPPAAPVMYTVRSGDSLSAIARRHGVTTQQMIDANRHRYPSLEPRPWQIQIGWTFVIPGGSTTVTPPSPTPTPQPPPSQPAPAQQFNDDILFVGMNIYGRDEARALERRGNRVTFIGDSAAGDDKVRAPDSQGRQRTFDLTRDVDLRDYVMTFGLPGDQTQKVIDAIKMIGADGRDEFGPHAAIFARGERGTIPSRLVLSGHHVGMGVYGDDNGTLRWSAFEKLALALPRAMRQIEDLHIAGCYSGGEPMMEKLRAVFPNLKTIWAYQGSAPGSWTGAMPHQAAWDAGTRGRSANLSRNAAAGMRKGENVAVWTVQNGYSDGSPPTPYAQVRAAYDQRTGVFDRFFSGQSPVSDPQSGPLRDFYNHLQRLLQHRDTPASDRPALESRRDVAIRLLYYSAAVAPRFATHHAGLITSGFEALGLSVPDFTRLSRADALARIRTFETALSSRNPKPAAAQALQTQLASGLRELRTSHIPDGWV
jgi:murein DD-endopeptidase MepM/ murein hydrolase activator NlpD